MTTVTLLGILFVSGAGDARQTAIDLMDSYYQSQFANLELIKDGRFGTTRIESSQIENHDRKGGDPVHKMKEIATEVKIFGNKGKKLNPGTIGQRYHRWVASHKPGEREILPPKTEELDPLIKFAASRSLAGRPGPFSKDIREWRVDVRRINLSKKECVSCHKGSKQGDPVALIAYMARKR